jgi:alkylation response protein AidB-like acyl-CoA dehydrogenase
MHELTDTQRQLQAAAQRLAVEKISPRAAEVDRSEAYPWDNVALLKEAGFMGMTVPESLGGPGLSYLDTVLVIEEMAKACGVTARIVVEANMGAVGAIPTATRHSASSPPARCSVATSRRSASPSPERARRRPR